MNSELEKLRKKLLEGEVNNTSPQTSSQTSAKSIDDLRSILIPNFKESESKSFFKDDYSDGLTRDQYVVKLKEENKKIREIEKAIEAQLLADQEKWDNSNVFEKIASTVGRGLTSIGSGFLNTTEGTADWVLNRTGDVASLIGQKDFADSMYDAAQQNFYNDTLINTAVDYYEPTSYIKSGDLADNVLSGVGQLGANYGMGYLLGGAGAGMGLGEKGQQFTSNLSPLFSVWGRNETEALRDGASRLDAVLYGAGSGTLEALVERISGGLGGLGGNNSLDNYIFNKIANSSLSNTGKNLVQLGLNSFGEGVEEVVTGKLDPYLQRMTINPNAENYTLKEGINDFVVGALTSALVGSPKQLTNVWENTNTSNNSNKSEDTLKNNHNVDVTIINERINEINTKLDDPNTNTKDIQKLLTEKNNLEVELEGIISVENIETESNVKTEDSNTTISDQIVDIMNEPINSKKVSDNAIVNQLIDFINNTEGLVVDQNQINELKQSSVNATNVKDVNAVVDKLVKVIDSNVIESKSNLSELIEINNTQPNQTVSNLIQNEQVKLETLQNKKVETITKLDESKIVKSRTNKENVKNNVATKVDEVSQYLNKLIEYETKLGNTKVKATLVAPTTAIQQSIVDVGAMFGKQVLFYEGNIDVNGAAVGNDVILLNTKMTVPGNQNVSQDVILQWTLGHEVFHSLKNSNPELFNEYVDYVKDKVDPTEVDQYINQFNDSNYREYLAENRDVAIEEMVADEFGNMFIDSEYFSQLRQDKPNLFKRLVKAIVDILDSIGDSNFSSRLTKDQVNHIRDKFANETLVQLEQLNTPTKAIDVKSSDTIVETTSTEPNVDDLKAIEQENKPKDKKILSSDDIKSRIMKLQAERQQGIDDSEIDDILKRDRVKMSKNKGLSDVADNGKKLSSQQLEYFEYSVIKDILGRLKEMYHGSPTATKIDEFKLGKRSDRDPTDLGWLGEGFYFTDDIDVAIQYTDDLDLIDGIKDPMRSGKIKKVYLNVKNPYINTNPELTIDDTSFIESLGVKNATEARQKLINEGYDGVVNVLQDGSLEVMVLNSNQIKDIKNTNPTDSPNIKLSKPKSDYVVPETMYRGIDPRTDGEKMNGTAGITFYSSLKNISRTYSPKGVTTESNISNQVKNPLVIEGNGAVWNSIEYNNKKYTTNQLARMAQQQGYDSVIFKNILDQGGKFPSGLGKNDSALSDVIAVITQPNVEVKTSKSKLPAVEKHVETGTGKSKFSTNTLLNQNIIQNIDKYTSDKQISNYKKISNEQSITEAAKRLKEGGPSEIYRWFSSDTNSSVDVAEGAILLDVYRDSGDTLTTQSILRKIREMGTKGGQTVQSLKILQKLDPENMAYYAQSELTEAFNELDKLNDPLTQAWLRENASDFTLNKSEIDWIQKTMSKVNSMDFDSREARIEMAKITQLIQNKIPPKRGDSIKAWARISMLFNPKTQVRNVVSNVVALPVNISTDFIGNIIDSQLAKDTGVRTTGNTSLKSLSEGFKKGFNDTVQDRKLGINTKSSDPFEIGKGNSFNTKSKLGRALNSIESTVNFSLELGDRPFFEAYFNNSLNNQMKLNNTTTPTVEMTDIAYQEAATKTWQDQGGFAKGVIKARTLLNNINVKGYGLGDIMVPFAITPANIIKATIDFSPVGLTKAVVSDLKKFNDAKKLGRADSKLQKKAVDSLSKGMAGTMLYVIAGTLADMGVITGGEDDDKDVAAFMKSIGINPYSVQINGKSYSYDWAQPFSTPSAIMADVKKLKNENELNKNNGFGSLGDNFNIMMNALSLGGNTVYEQSFLRSIATLFGGDGPTEGLVTLVSDIPSRFTPTLFKQFADLIDDNIRMQYEYNNTIGSSKNKVLNKIPGLRESLPIKRDVLGNEAKSYGGDNNIFNVFFNPANVSEDTLGALGQEILEIYNATGDKTIIPKVVASYKVHNGIKYSFNNKQKSEMQKIMGETVANTLSGLMKTEQYNNLSYKERASMLNDLISYAEGKSIEDTQSIPGYTINTQAGKIIDKYLDNGMTMDNALYYKTVINSIDPDKDANGDSIQGSGVGKKAWSIVNMDTTDFQKNIMLEQITTSKVKPQLDDLANIYSEQGMINYYALPSNDYFVSVNISREDYAISTLLGISSEVFGQFAKNVGDLKSDKDVNGNTISGSKKAKVVNYIESLPLNVYQKVYLLSVSGYSIKEYKGQMYQYVESLSLTIEQKQSLWKSLGY